MIQPETQILEQRERQFGIPRFDSAETLRPEKHVADFEPQQGGRDRTVGDDRVQGGGAHDS